MITVASAYLLMDNY